jgi:hypothetical protein
MSINTFDDKSTARIGRTVRSYEKSVLGKPNLSNRRIPISGGKSTSASTTYPAVVQSGSNGVYSAKKVDLDTGELSDTAFTLFASRATGYDLTANKSIVGMEVSLTTMG